MKTIYFNTVIAIRIIEYFKQDNTKGVARINIYDKYNTDPKILKRIENIQNKLLNSFNKRKSKVKRFNIYEIDYKEENDE